MSNYLLEKPRTNPELLKDLLNDAMNGFRKCCVLSAAIELGVFDALKHPKSIDELAEELKCDRKLLFLFCEVLRGLNLVTKKDNRYFNTDLANEFLTEDSFYSQTTFIENGVENLKLWLKLSEILKDGPIKRKSGKFFAEKVIHSLAQNSLTGELQMTVKIISAFPEFHKAKKLLDLGGGHGLYAIAFSALNKNLHAYVLDLPGVVEKTNEYIRKFKAERVKVIPGNFFNNIPAGYDIIFSSYNPGGKNPQLIPKIHSSLNRGGLYVNKQFFGDVKEVTLLDLEWNLWTFEGIEKAEKAYTFKNDLSLKDYIKKLEDTGFKVLKVFDIDFEMDDKMIVAKKVE